jgi:hypothetical protein
MFTNSEALYKASELSVFYKLKISHSKT